MTDGNREQDGALDAALVQQVMKEARDLARALEGTATSRIKIKAGPLEVEVERAGGVMVAAAPGMMPVVAPLVGVYYSASSPGAKPFVEVGDTVERGQVVGIVEAMKVMNEVTSDYRGRVAEILVENGEAVQFEQRLMLIDTGA